MKYSSIFNYPTLNWADIGVIGWLVDGAAIVNRGAVPRVLRPLCAGDGENLQRGKLPPAPWLRGGDGDGQRQRHAARHVAGRYRSLLVAGADDVRPERRRLPHSAQSMAWKIKRHSNDELRQKFVDNTVPQLEALGMTAPDPSLTGRGRRPLSLRRNRLERTA